MPLISLTTLYVKDTLVKQLDDANKNVYIQYGFENIIKGIAQLQTSLEQAEAKHLAEEESLIKKYEGIIGVRKLRLLKSFNLNSTLYDPKFTHGFLPIEVQYEKDKLIAIENEEIIKTNTEIINQVAQTMELAGIGKTTLKHATSRSKTKTSFPATWWLELTSLYPSTWNNIHPLWNLKGLEADYAFLRKQYELYLIDLKQKEVENAKEKQAKEFREQLEKAKQQEAILIAHTCLRYALDPSKVTTRLELDSLLIEKGEIPDSIIEALKNELSLT